MQRADNRGGFSQRRVGRVHVHLADNRKDEQFPFAFLATYTTRLSAQAKAQHRPLGEALREYAAASDMARLLALLAPLQRAGDQESRHAANQGGEGGWAKADSGKLARLRELAGRSAAAGAELGRSRRSPAQPALPLRQRSKVRGLLRLAPVISRQLGGGPPAPMVTCPCSTPSSLRCGSLVPMKMATTPQPWAWAPLNASSPGADRIGEHRPGDETPLVKLGSGTA